MTTSVIFRAIGPWAVRVIPSAILEVKLRSLLFLACAMSPSMDAFYDDGHCFSLLSLVFEDCGHVLVIKMLPLGSVHERDRKCENYEVGAVTVCPLHRCIAGHVR